MNGAIRLNQEKPTLKRYSRKIGQGDGIEWGYSMI